AAGGWGLAPWVHSRYRIPCSKCHELLTTAVQESVGANRKSTYRELRQGFKDLIQFAFVARKKSMHSQAQRLSRLLEVLQLSICRHDLWVDEDCNPIGTRCHFVQHLDLLLPKKIDEEIDARDVASGPVQASNQSHLDRIGAIYKDDRYSQRRRLGSE